MRPKDVAELRELLNARKTELLRVIADNENVVRQMLKPEDSSSSRASGSA